MQNSPSLLDEILSRQLALVYFFPDSPDKTESNQIKSNHKVMTYIITRIHKLVHKDTNCNNLRYSDQVSYNFKKYINFNKLSVN